MSDTPDVVSTTDTPAAAPEAAKPELKSTDTGVLAALKPKADTAPPPKAEKPEAKPDSNASPAVKGRDADSAADHQDDERPLEPWMKKRLVRAEEKGRKLGRAELLDEVRTLRPGNDQAKAPAASQQQQQESELKLEKSLADFDYDVEKYSRYVSRETLKHELAQRDAAQEQQRKERKAQEARDAFDKHKAEFESRVGEGAWDEMVSAKVDVPQDVVDLLMGHPLNLDIAHYLVNHTDELDGLRGKSKLEIARGLSAIETKLSGSSREQQELPPKTTKTPPPPPKVTGAGKSVKSIAEMSTAERIAEWKRQKQQRQAS